MTVNLSTPSLDIQQIGRFYLIEDENQLIEFVSRNPEIVTLLLEAQKQIRKYFPQERLVLNVSSDSDYIEWERVKIFIYVGVNDVDEASDKLSQFDNDWWLDNCSGIGLKLYIGLEFE